jgi:Ser/Thr protein kinase RdoA (MazF antagonist)
MNPAPHILKAVEATLGDRAKVVGQAQASTQADVFELQSGGQRYALKVHRRHSGHRREELAYQKLAALGASWLPKLFAAGEDFLLLEWVLGQGLADLIEPGEIRSAFEQAGRARRDLLNLECADSQKGTESLNMRLEEWCRRAGKRVPPELVAKMQEELRTLADVDEPLRSFSHRDFRSENWIIESDGRLRIVDWGHSRCDFWVADLAKLCEEEFVAERAAFDWFMQGFGRSLSSGEERYLLFIRQLHGLQSYEWGALNGDAEIASLGRRILKRHFGVELG